MDAAKMMRNFWKKLRLTPVAGWDDFDCLRNRGSDVLGRSNMRRDSAA